MNTNKVSMPNKIFGTVVAHSLRGKMLSKTELQTLAESRDIEELVTRMKNTVYLDALAKLTRPFTAEKVEGALREYLVNQHAEELVGRRDLVVKALVAKDFDEAVNSLAGSEFGEDAKKAAQSYKEKGDVRVFDTYLDHAFYKSLDRAVVFESKLQDAQKLVGIDIDTYNVLAVLRGKYWGLSPADITDLIVTTTTKVSKDTLQKMINTEKIQEAIGELAATNYKDLIPRSAANDIDAIMQLEAGFEKEALKRIMNSFRTVFTIANLLASLKLMGYEIRNLAAIAAGVEQKISADKIMVSLVPVEQWQQHQQQ